MNSSPNTAMLACGGAGTSSASSLAATGSSGGLQFPGMPNTFTIQPGPLQQLQQLNESLKSEPGQDAVGAAPHNHVQPDTAYGYAGAYPGAAYLPVNAYAHLYNNPLQMWQAHAAYANYNLGIGQNKKGGSSSRQTYARWQTEILEACFRGNEYVTKKKREELHAATTLSDRQIKIWFQNRRMKKKKEQKRTTECSSGQSPTNSNGRPPPPQAPCMSGNLTVKREAAFTSDATYHESSASLASPKSDDVPDVKDYKLPETIPNSLSYTNA
ncbi:EGL-5 protein, partial [Aphelenchoides avenae]